ncbi:hypothetical protein ACFO4P_12925 [Epilithonimonas pallida]|uniref:Uncharacterized protein n=1 Tax=Epilithonimonas pallida TaxID=373671 RepID=A0ABY1R4Q0_9FLAO|nr:hypothetical protein [Epilithonimonas pallida]SMP95461.1 hypothetical protein SAMN05421679_107131 [Epilithonimonas pallida]
MTLDIDKAKKIQDRLNEQSVREVLGELPVAIINLLNSKVLNYCLHEHKTGIKTGHPIRIVNSWLAQDVIKIQEGDKGKIRRFDRLENIWLNIVFDARKFGIPIDDLKYTRKKLFESPVKNFSLFKLGVIKTIFAMPQVLVFPIGGKGSLYSIDAYAQWFSKKRFPPHAAFRLEDYIALEYPNNAFSEDFHIKNLFEDKNKMLLQYFLKTGDYQYVKVHLKQGDVRLIENSKSLIQNEEVMRRIGDWNFHKIDIIINDDLATSIKP